MTTFQRPHTLSCAFCAIAALTLFLCCGKAIASTSISFRHVGIESGASHPRVNDITIGNRGFVWVSTLWGVDRFDGDEVIPLAMPDHLTPATQIISTQELGADSLLVKTTTGFLLYSRSAAEFRPIGDLFTYSGAKQADDAWVDNRDNLWILSGTQVFVQPAKGDSKSFSLPPNTSVVTTCNTRFGIAILLSNGNILRCYAPNDGDMPAPQTTVSPLTNGCRRLKADFDGNLWALSAQGDSLWFSRLSGNDWELINTSTIWPNPSPKNIIDVAADTFDRVWLATQHDGLYVLDFPSNKSFPIRRDPMRPNGLRSNDCTCVTTTKSGYVFVGYTFSGFSFHHPTSFIFNSVTLPNPLHRLADVNAIATHDGYAYVATASEGLFEVNVATLASSQLTTPSLGSVDNVAVQPDGTLWFSFDGGQIGYRRKGAAPTFLKKDLLPSALRNDVPCQFAVDKDGNLWAASNNDVAVIPQGMALDGVIEFKVSDIVVHMSRPAKGAGVAILTRSDIVRASRSLFTIHVDTLVNQRLAAFRPTNVAIDDDNVLWVSSLSAVRAYTFDAQHRYVNVGSVNVNMPVALVTSDRGGIVVTTPTDAYAMRYAASDDNPSPHFITEFHPRPAPLLEGAACTYATCLMPNGDFWIGAENGIVTFSPSLFKHEDLSNITFCSLAANGNIVMPEQKIDDITIIKSALPFASHIQLPASSDIFTIHFATIGHAPQSYTYVCYLEGSDAPPFCTSEPYYTFHNLQPGSYTLKVRAKDPSGHLSSDYASIDISIRTPWRESTWAKGFMVIAALIMAVLFTYIVMSYLNAAKINEMAKAQAKKAMSTAEVNQLRREALVGMASDLSDALVPLADDINKISHLKGIPQDSRIHITHLSDRITAANAMISNAIQTAEGVVVGESKPIRNDICAYIKQICESMTNITRGHVYVLYTTSPSSLLTTFDPLMLRFILVDILSDAVVAAQDIGYVKVKVETGKFESNVVSITISVGGVDTTHSRYFSGGKLKLRHPIAVRLEMMDAKLSTIDNGDGIKYAILLVPLK